MTNKLIGAICNGGEKKPVGSVHYCKKCKRKTGDTMQDYYDDVFCKECGFRKGTI